MEVIRNLDLEIHDGEFLVLVGPSGCGKSTLLRLIAGLDQPTKGQIYVGERKVSHLRPAKRNVAMVFQSYALYPHLSVRNNLAFGLRRSKQLTLNQRIQDLLHRSTRSFPKSLQVTSPREINIEARTNEVANALQLKTLLNRLPKELSGGQKQRVALGRAMARHPDVFLMDEPLSNLDAKLRNSTRSQIVELQKKLGTTTLYVTHDQVEAMTMGHRIAVLNQGQLQQLGTPMNLYKWPSNLFVAQFIGNPPMTILPITVAPGKTLLLGSKRLPVEGYLSDVLPQLEGQALSAGLRPEQWRLGPATNRNLPAEVSTSEMLGNEQLITCRLLEGNHLIQVRADPELEATVGSTIHLEPDPQGWRLFDGRGEAICTPRDLQIETSAPKS